MANARTTSSRSYSDDDNMYTYGTTIKTKKTDEQNIKNIFVVRESKFFQKEWIDLKRPICFKELNSAQTYVESQIDEVEIKMKFEKNEEVKIERLASSMTWYYTVRSKSFSPIIRFEIYLTNLL